MSAAHQNFGLSIGGDLIDCPAIKIMEMFFYDQRVSSKQYFLLPTADLREGKTKSDKGIRCL